MDSSKVSQTAPTGQFDARSCIQAINQCMGQPWCSIMGTHEGGCHCIYTCGETQKHGVEAVCISSFLHEFVFLYGDAYLMIKQKQTVHQKNVLVGGGTWCALVKLLLYNPPPSLPICFRNILKLQQCVTQLHKRTYLG